MLTLYADYTVHHPEPLLERNGWSRNIKHKKIINKDNYIFIIYKLFINIESEEDGDSRSHYPNDEKKNKV